MNIPAILTAASLYHAHSLKEVCFEYIFVRGKDLLLNNPAFDDMAPHLLVELLRDNATRRSVRTQFVFPAAVAAVEASAAVVAVMTFVPPESVKKRKAVAGAT